jgi:hypothetical protein
VLCRGAGQGHDLHHRPCRETTRSSTPIADHAFLSDRHPSALVDRAGSVEWLRFPRFDGPSVFARLLDDDAGHCQVRPEEASTTTRHSAGRSLASETRFWTAHGRLVLTDVLRLGPDNDGHRLGIDVPHVLVRRPACTSGAVDPGRGPLRARVGPARPGRPDGSGARGLGVLVREASTP